MSGFVVWGWIFFFVLKIDLFGEMGGVVFVVSYGCCWVCFSCVVRIFVVFVLL